MTVITLEECLPVEQRAFNRANAKTVNCGGMYGYKKCDECRLFTTCDLQTRKRQAEINLTEIKRKIDEKNNQGNHQLDRPDDRE